MIESQKNKAPHNEGLLDLCCFLFIRNNDK